MAKVFWFFLLVLACSLLLLPSGCGGGSQSKQPPPPTNVIAYLHRTGLPNNYIIYDLKVMRSDGTSTTVLSSRTCSRRCSHRTGRRFYTLTTIPT